MELNAELIRKIVFEAVQEALKATPMWPRWLPLKEAARYAGISTKKLRQLVEQGEIRAKRLEGKWIVDRLSIDEFYEKDWVEMQAALHRVLKR